MAFFCPTRTVSRLPRVMPVTLSGGVQKKPSVAVSSAGLIKERRALLDLWSRRRRSEAAQIVDFEGVKKT
jgi:hypothetical protein